MSISYTSGAEQSRGLYVPIQACRGTAPDAAPTGLGCFVGAPNPMAGSPWAKGYRPSADGLSANRMAYLSAYGPIPDWQRVAGSVESLVLGLCGSSTVPASAQAVRHRQSVDVYQIKTRRVRQSEWRTVRYQFCASTAWRFPILIAGWPFAKAGQWPKSPSPASWPSGSTSC